MPDQRLQHLTKMAQSIAVPIFILEVQPEGRLIFRSHNRFHEETTGMSSADSAGKTPHDILPPRIADSVMAKYLTCVETRQPFSYEEVMKLPAGEIWWQTTLSPIFFDDGSVIGIFGLAVDISARKSQEFRDAAALAELKKLNEEINIYSSMAAHDVRGPLRKILVMQELLQEEAKSGADGTLVVGEMGKQLLADISQVAQGALGHVDSILTYSRALTLDSKPKLEEVDLGLLFADLVGLVDAHGSFSFDYPSDVVMAERIILQITLRNLMENAVKFGANQCTVSLCEDPDSPQVLQFVVSDDGSGFADGAQLSDQSERSRLKSPITGFGLASAQRMVETRGGKVWLAEPRLGKGASVAFTTAGSILARAEAS